MSGLTPEQRRLREGKLSASEVGRLMTGDPDKIMNLWRVKVGEIEEDDLSDVWPVQLGIHTEALNLAWYERNTGHHLFKRGSVVTHPTVPWACSTLDGFDIKLVGPVDAKHVGGFEKLQTIVARYSAQMHWQMDCTGTTRSALSIIEGSREPVIEYIDWDAEYSAELWRRAEIFMQCVWDLTPPVAFPPIQAPVAAVKEVDMTGSNAWAVNADAWLKTKGYARSCVLAEKALKELVAPDVRRAYGGGIEITRDRANRMSVKELRS